MICDGDHLLILGGNWGVGSARIESENTVPDLVHKDDVGLVSALIDRVGVDEIDNGLGFGFVGRFPAELAHALDAEVGVLAVAEDSFVAAVEVRDWQKLDNAFLGDLKCLSGR